MYKHFYETKRGSVRVEGLLTWVSIPGFNVEKRNPEHEMRTDLNEKINQRTTDNLQRTMP